MTPPAPFSLQIHTQDDTTRVIVRGELDLATVPKLEHAVARLNTGRQPRRLVLDLRELDFMDCSGLHLLLRCEHAARRAGRAFLVIRGPEAVQRLFQLAGAEQRLNVIDAADTSGPT